MVQGQESDYWPQLNMIWNQGKVCKKELAFYITAHENHINQCFQTNCKCVFKWKSLLLAGLKITVLHANVQNSSSEDYINITLNDLLLHIHMAHGFILFSTDFLHLWKSYVLHLFPFFIYLCKTYDHLKYHIPKLFL